MFTDREGKGGYFNRVASMDARMRPSESDSISFNAACSSTQYSQEMQYEFGLASEEMSDHALSLKYVHSNRNWFAFADTVTLAKTFEPISDSYRGSVIAREVGERRTFGGGRMRTGTTVSNWVVS